MASREYYDFNGRSLQRELGFDLIALPAPMRIVTNAYKTAGHAKREWSREKSAANAKSSGAIQPALDARHDCATYTAVPLLSDGSEGAPLELRSLFNEFFDELGPHA